MPDFKAMHTLEDLEFSSNGSPLLRDLNATGAGSNDCASLATDVNALWRPERRMVHGPLELVETTEVRDITFGGEAGCNDEELCFGGTSVDGLDGPFAFLLVELGADNARLESTVLAQAAPITRSAMTMYVGRRSYFSTLSAWSKYSCLIWQISCSSKEVRILGHPYSS